MDNFYHGTCVEAEYMERSSSSEGGRGRKKNINTKAKTEFKSKNLEAERKRREKLGARLMVLRSLVPIITNLKKATIIEDAIAYIEMLQAHVKSLSDELHERNDDELVLKLSDQEDEEEKMGRKDADEVMEKLDKCESYQDEVKVVHIGDNKLLLKIICKKKRGRFTEFMEIIRNLGFVVTDANVTTNRCVALILIIVEVSNFKKDTMKQVREVLAENLEASHMMI